MRPLESIILLGLAASLILFLLPAGRRPTWARQVPTAAAVLVLLQLVVEGYRYQMALAYPLCVAVIVAAAMAKTSARSSWRRAGAVALTLVGMIVLLLVAALAAGSPVFELPDPTGPHRVGVTRLYVADPAREELYTADLGDHRELMLRIWYPAVPEQDATPVPYWDDAEQVGPWLAQLTRDVFGLVVGDRSFDHYELVPTHSFRDARPSPTPKRFPVLVFSHGYAIAGPEANTALMEELASRGYWVASIAHTYETPAVVFADGRVVGFDPATVSGLFGHSSANAFFETYPTTDDPAERDEMVRAFLAVQTSTSRSMRVWNADTRTVVDEIERVASGERETPFAGRLDLERLGVLGMSFGGATAAAFCVEDPRCKAGLNLDGFHYGDGMADAVVRVPFMIVSAQRSGIPINDFFFRHAAGPAYHLTVAGSKHANFTDSSISSPLLRWLGVLGAIDGRRMLEILNVYVPAFFDHYLLGSPAPLLERDSTEFTEVELESRNTS